MYLQLIISVPNNRSIGYCITLCATKRKNYVNIKCAVRMEFTTQNDNSAIHRVPRPPFAPFVLFRPLRGSSPPAASPRSPFPHPSPGTTTPSPDLITTRNRGLQFRSAGIGIPAAAFRTKVRLAKPTNPCYTIAKEHPFVYSGYSARAMSYRLGGSCMTYAAFCLETA